MKAAVATPLEIFYDGACIVCATEIDIYRRKIQDGRLVFIDISAEGFVAADYQRSLEDFMAEMHLRDARGEFYTGVDAFLKLWEVMPDYSIYRFMGTVISLPGINLASRLGYRLFARYRYLLPKRKPDCDSGTCDLKQPRKSE